MPNKQENKQYTLFLAYLNFYYLLNILLSIIFFFFRMSLMSFLFRTSVFMKVSFNDSLQLLLPDSCTTLELLSACDHPHGLACLISCIYRSTALFLNTLLNFLPDVFEYNLDYYIYSRSKHHLLKSLYGI